MTPDDFWAHYEKVVHNFDELISSINSISQNNRELAWRGQVNSNWALDSNLFRRIRKKLQKTPNESALAKFEQHILIEFRKWGLHISKTNGRLSILQQLAILQHFKSPTRLIDISFNPLVATFFATEKNLEYDDYDARIFIFDIKDRIINDKKSIRPWEDSIDTPWSESYIENQYYTMAGKNELSAYSNHTKNKIITLSEFNNKYKNEWSSNFYIWKPTALDSRISSQNGGFILGGSPISRKTTGFLDTSLNAKDSTFQIQNPDSSAIKKYLSIEEARNITSVAIQPKRFDGKFPPSSSVYSIRIKSSAKEEIRKILKNVYGYKYSNIYPDYTGFSEYADSILDLK